MKKKRLSDDVRVNTTREKSEKAARQYINNPTEVIPEKLQNCKENLQNIYNQVEEEELDKMIKEVESTYVEAKTHESWKFQGGKLRNLSLKQKAKKKESKNGIVILNTFLVMMLKLKENLKKN